MKEVFVSAMPIIAEIRDADIPVPAADEVLIKVVAAGSNPKDWKHPFYTKSTVDSGDDIAGTIHALGSSVTSFHLQDRVAAFHKMGAPHGAYAEYAIAPASTTFSLPPNISFEQGATVPLAAMTAALSLYQHMGLPLPWNKAQSKEPILIYGGATAVGAFAIQFAKLSGLGPIVAIAGSGGDFAKSLGADFVVDYRRGKVVEDVKEALRGLRLRYAIDVVGEKGSWERVLEVLEKDKREKSFFNMLTIPDGVVWPEGVVFSRTYVGSAYGDSGSIKSGEEERGDTDFAYIFYKYISRILEDGRLKPHPVEILPGGLTAVQSGLEMLYQGKVSAKKLVYRIADTPNL